MSAHRARVLAFAVAIAAVIAAPAAADVSKETCLESHSRGQDARERGKLSLARRLLLTCAQPACPALVQGDCARMADDLTRLQPTLSFVARDDRGNDLPDTTVYVDSALVATQLDDGKPHDVDPGRHIVKFVHGDDIKVITIVVGTGEKGRAVVATFRSKRARADERDRRASEPAVRRDTAPRTRAKPTTKTVRPTGAVVMMVGGGIAVAGGATLAVIGLTGVPPSCSISTHQCSAPPGDPVFEQARSSMNVANLGLIAGGVGATVALGGIVWYMTGGTRKRESRDETVVAPWVTPNDAGVSVSGRF